MTLNEDQLYEFQRRVGELQSLGTILRLLAELEGQDVELTVLADLGQVISRNASEVLEAFLDPVNEAGLDCESLPNSRVGQKSGPCLGECQ